MITPLIKHITAVIIHSHHICPVFQEKYAQYPAKQEAVIHPKYDFIELPFDGTIPNSTAFSSSMPLARCPYPRR